MKKHRNIDKGTDSLRDSVRFEKQSRIEREREKEREMAGGVRRNGERERERGKW